MLVNIHKKWVFAVALSLWIGGCNDHAMNDPYPHHSAEENVLYTSFSQRPNHLDPARSYASNEWIITNQIYEPPLQYHYLKRPYQLVPLGAKQMPKITYVDANGQTHDKLSADEIKKTIYEISIPSGTMYQPHPAFAQTEEGQFLYHQLSEDDLDGIEALSDFANTGTRELKAQDYIYQIKRLADPTLNSPIFGLMENYIAEIDSLQETLGKVYADQDATFDLSHFLDLRPFTMEGAKAIDDYTYTITINGYYPQFIYWLAMPFFAPVPWEADKFYHQTGLIERNITLDWYPVGTGPYYLAENNPNHRMRLVKNPNFKGELFPLTGMPEDEAAGLLANAGKALPMLDEISFALEKENIPYWNKFLQGYYDQSGISSDSFDQALQDSSGNGLALTEPLMEKGINLYTSTLPTTFYWGFNMLDEVVGGYDEASKKLRRAISIGINVEEYIQIFLNARAIPAMSPIPPGLFGYLPPEQDYNAYVYEKENGQLQRRSIEQAKDLLAQAGYPEGRDPKTGKPLTLFLDATMGGGPDSQAFFGWMRKQFANLGIELVVRATQYNRFQEKIRTGNAQIFQFGWNADYPDPENFLFLLYGPSAKVPFGGENAVNYQNEAFDKMFKQMKTMENGPERQALILEMLELLREEAPWIWGIHPKLYALSHGWVGPQKPNAMSRNTLKYLSVNPQERAEQRKAWNQPIWWPMILIGLLGLLICLPAWLMYRKKIRKPTPLSQLESDT